VTQLDTDGDLDGDACDNDDDDDGIVDADDNCSKIVNTDQGVSHYGGFLDDGIFLPDAPGRLYMTQNTGSRPPGDACNDDWDFDAILNVNDNCPYVYNPAQSLLKCWNIDWDFDGVVWEQGVNETDNCRAVANGGTFQADEDGGAVQAVADGYGVACDADIDGDGDPNYSNADIPDDPDMDGDGIDEDGDGDGEFLSSPCPDGVVVACDDNCPFISNAGQADVDGNGIGDACE